MNNRKELRVLGEKSEFFDSDGDTIDDKWELKSVGSLTVMGKGTDYDGDGYFEVQEYLNYVNQVYDAVANEFNPTRVNAPYGEGYVIPVPPVSGVKSLFPAWSILLLKE